MFVESDVLELKSEYTPDIRYEDTRSMIQELTFEAAQAEFKRRGLAFGKSQKISLGICDSEGIYSNLGLLLSDQCQHSIKVAVFKGLEKDVFLARKEFNGSLFAQINETYAFMELNNQVASTFEGLYRHDSQDYSETALREALLNAVVHREYAFSGSILVSIFSDRMEIVSLGGLTSGIEREDIFEGISQTRNAKLANVFYRLELIKAYGTGIRKILHACREKGVEPEFSTTHAVFRVIIPNQNALRISYSTANPLKNDQVRETGDSAQDMVYAYVASHEDVSRKLIQETLKLKQTKTITVLKLLEENGRIVRAGQGKNTRYRVGKPKY